MPSSNTVIPDKARSAADPGPMPERIDMRRRWWRRSGMGPGFHAARGPGMTA